MTHIFFVVHPSHGIFAELGVVFGGVGVQSQAVIIAHCLAAAFQIFMLGANSAFFFATSFELNFAEAGGTGFP